MALAIRGATSADAGPIAEVQVACFAVWDRVPVDQGTVERRKVVWRDILAAVASDGFALVAERDSRVVGFCHLATPSRDPDANARAAELTSIYVAPQRWRRGTGAALLGRAIDELAATGWREVTLWVLAANDRARAFYSALVSSQTAQRRRMNQPVNGRCACAAGSADSVVLAGYLP